MMHATPIKPVTGQTPASRSSAIMVVPIPPVRPVRKKFWRVFLNDLSYLLPGFSTCLGFILMFTEIPYFGATMTTIGGCVLALRVHSAVEARREQRRMELIDQWYREFIRRGIQPPDPFDDSNGSDVFEALYRDTGKKDGKVGKQAR